MSLFEEFGNLFKTMRVYLLGRGFLSLLIMGAVAMTSTGSTLVLGLVAAGGLAISAGMRLYSQRLYENDMTDLYREDIAMHLGMDPRAVTRAHLKIAARENEVIEQALARQRRINIVSFATSALAAAATFGMLSFGLAGDVGNAITKFFGAHISSDALANFARYTAVGIVSGTSSLILHNGLEEAIGHGIGLNKAIAHDLIVVMDRDVKRGRSITPEQVYAVLVAESPELQQSIATRFNEPFHRMTAREQRSAMKVLGVTQDMTEIAEIITKGDVPPGRLAYMIHYSRPVKKIEATVSEPAPANGKFVERLGLAAQAQASHTQRVDTSREAAIAHSVA